MSQTHLRNPFLARDASQEILKAVESIKSGSGFGSIEIVVHEGRVTQIEKREKIRIANQKNSANTISVLAES